MNGFTLPPVMMLAACGRVYKFDPPLNPRLGGGFGWNQQG